MFRQSAHVYDLVYGAQGKDYAAEATAVDEQIRALHPDASSLLDVACGTGAHLAHLRAWYDVVGLDVDDRMLVEARRRLHDVPLVQADMRAFRLDRTFDAITCLFSSIGYAASTADLHRAIACMGAHLAPGGVLVVDGWVRVDEWYDPGVVDALAGRDADVAVARVSRSYRDDRLSRLEMHYLVATLEGVEHIVEHHTLTLFTDEEYRAAFEAAGLDVEVVECPLPGRDRYIGRPSTQDPGS